MSKARARALAAESKMLVGRAPGWMRIIVEGPAGKIPSVSNSRLTMFPKKGILSLMQQAHDNCCDRNEWKAISLLKSAMAKLKGTRAINTMNPEHKERLAALSLLWDSVGEEMKNGLPLDANKRKWVVWLVLPDSLNRVDSHNVPKALCDWLEEVGIIQNDRNIDCLPLRAKDVGMPRSDWLQIGIHDWVQAREQIIGLPVFTRMMNQPTIQAVPNGICSEECSTERLQMQAQQPLMLRTTNGGKPGGG